MMQNEPAIHDWDYSPPRTFTIVLLLLSRITFSGNFVKFTTSPDRNLSKTNKNQRTTLVRLDTFTYFLFRIFVFGYNRVLLIKFRKIRK